jgi:FKBP-type peptidyl-prolyl cis-trans isomerase
MRVGGERRLRVAPHLAYRDQAIPGQVPARAVLEFYVTLLRVDRDTEAQ